MTQREANADQIAEITALRDRVASQGRQIAELQGALAQGSHREAATSEILRVISQSPSDVQPVFDAIVESSRRLLNGFSAIVTRLVGDGSATDAEAAAYAREVLSLDRAVGTSPARAQRSSLIV